MPAVQVRGDDDLAWLVVLSIEGNGQIQNTFNRAVESTEINVMMRAMCQRSFLYWHEQQG